MEGATITIFWGSILAQYLWIKRQSLCNEAKSSLKKIWKASIETIKSSIKYNSVTFKQKEEDNAQNNEDISNILNQEKEQKNLINKQKKIRKAKQNKPKNLRRLQKKYEDWFIQNLAIKKMANKISKASLQRDSLPFEFKRQSCQFEENMVNYNTQKLYEEYLNENEDQYNNGAILGYNPIVSDDEELDSSIIQYNYDQLSYQ